MGFPVRLMTGLLRDLESMLTVQLVPNSKTNKMFNISFIEKFIKNKKFDSRRYGWKKIWMLLNIELWMQDKNL